MKRLAVIALLSAVAFAPAVSARNPVLTVKQTAKTTTVKVHYKAGYNMLKFPDFVIFGIGFKPGKTIYKFNSPFLTDMVFDIDKAIVFPAGQLDEKGNFEETFPFGNKGFKTFDVYLQANVLHFKMKVFPKFTFVGQFLKSNRVKVTIGIGFKK